jgi:hypothetical protein
MRLLQHVGVTPIFIQEDSDISADDLENNDTSKIVVEPKLTKCDICMISTITILLLGPLGFLLYLLGMFMTSTFFTHY